MGPLLTLPQHHQARVLSFCSIRDVSSVAATSKLLQEMSSMDAVWWFLLFQRFPLAVAQLPAQTACRAKYYSLHVAYLEERTAAKAQHSARMAQRHWMACGVHMFHPVNGRRGFDLLSAPEWMCQRKPSLQVMKALLQRENTIRLQEGVQQLYSDTTLDNINMAAFVQQQVAQEYLSGKLPGVSIHFEPVVFPDCADAWQHNLRDRSPVPAPDNVQVNKCTGTRPLSVQEVVQMIRHAPCLYPDAPEMRTIPHYQKFNRAVQGKLRVGDRAPDANLMFLDGAFTTLKHFGECTASGWSPITKRPLVLCAGSYS